MVYVWQQSEQFVGARKHLPQMGDLFEHASAYVQAMFPEAGPRHIVDLGCGTGVTGGAMLDVFPRARLTLADFSEPMLEQARERYAADNRVTVVSADLSEQGVMRKICPEAVDVVVSSLAIHHLERRRQMTLYAEIWDVLEEGGVFVNIEHVASASKTLESIYWDRMYEHVTASKRAAGEPATVEQVRAEFEKRRHVNVLTAAETQVGWLRAIGFADADCVFKSFELAVLAGRKPPARTV
ncbi:MAG: class I SAM-dependent methyltransferase [Phycisphaeraceae bacterium]